MQVGIEVEVSSERVPHDQNHGAKLIGVLCPLPDDRSAKCGEIV